MTDMIERVARAIREGRMCGEVDAPLMVPCPFCNWGPDEARSDGSETGCLWLARAAIEAMREPTQEMRRRGDGALETASACDNVWDYMIDAALTP